MKRILLFLLALALWAAFSAVASAKESPAAPAEALEDGGAAGEAADVEGLDDLWGLTVKKIAYDLPPWMIDKEIKRVTKIRTGKPLTRARVRSTVRRIYLLGLVDNVLIKAAPAEDGVNVFVKVYPRYYIRDIEVKGSHIVNYIRDMEVKGLHALNYVEIVDDILRLSGGDEFHEENLPTYKKKILARYRDIGCLQASVDIDVAKTKLKDDAAADLLIRIKEGRVFKVRSINIEGGLGPWSREKILKKLDWREGMTYEKKRIAGGIKRLKEYFKSKKHYEARVGDIDLDDPKTVTIDQAAAAMDIHLRVEAGPLIEMAYGEECFTCAQKKWKLNGQLDVPNNRRFTKWILESYEVKIEQYFRARGYLDADAHGEFEEGTGDDGLPVKRLKFTLEKGRSYTIDKVDFKDNPTYADEKLKKQLELGNVFIQEDFDKNLENVIALYNQNGFLQAKVVQKNAQIDEGTGKIFITVVMSEGPRTLVGGITLTGNKVLGDKRFQAVLETAGFVKGKPYNPFLVSDVKTKMIAKYLTRGYIKARIREKVEISEDGERADITYEFEEGRPYYFGNVYVLGNKITKKHVILRELFITKGDPFNYEDVFSSQQQLMKLGFFSSVDISPVNPDLDEQDIDLLVTVDERNSGYILGGFGYNTFSGYQTAFELGHRNLAGHGRKLSFRADVSFRDKNLMFDQRAIAINFQWPWIARIPLDGELIVLDIQKKQIGYDLRTISSTQTVKVDFPKFFYYLKSTHRNEAIRWAARFWTGALSYAYAKDFIFNVDTSAVDQKPGEIVVATVSPQLMRDSRDNAFNPNSGKVYMASLEWAAPPLMSQIDYLKAIGQLSWYEPIFRWWGATSGPVLAFNIKAGHAQVLRKTDTIPINRRFYLGGSTTIRGFGQDQISPMAPDGRTPVGGNFYAYTNEELRIPVYDWGLGILLFFDAGNVTPSMSDFYISTVRKASGLGLQYISPVGPISLNYGLKLDRLANESVGEFYFTIGNAF